MHTKASALHQRLVQLRQMVERDAWIPMVLEMVANIAWQDKDRLRPGRNGRAGNRILFLVALYGAVLADQADVLNRDVPSAERHDPIKQKRVPGVEISEGCGARCIKA